MGEDIPFFPPKRRLNKMTNVKLLRKYKNKDKGDIVRISDEEATELLHSDSAVLATNRDFLIKPEFGVSKGFKKSPANN